MAAGGLGERLQQRHRKVLAQPGHLPVEAVGRHPVEHRDGHVHGDAVGGIPGRELVGDVELEVALAPGARVVGGRDLLPGLGREDLLGEGEQVGAPAPLAAPPAVEVPLGEHVGRDPAVVEGEEHLVVDDDVAPAGSLLELGDPGEGGDVALPEVVLRLPVALDEGRPHEDLAGRLGVDPGVLDGAVGDERHAVERHPLGRDGGARPAAPARLADGAGHDVCADLLGPLGLDGRVDARPQPARLDELGGHDEVGLLAEQRGPGADAETGTARPDVLPLDLVPGTDVRQQPGEQRLVDGVPVGLGVAGRGGDVGVDADRAAGGPQLGVQVLPLPDAQVVQVLVLAHAAKRAVRQLLCWSLR